MLAILLAPLYIYLNIYIGKWLLRWMENCSKIFRNKIIKVMIIAIHIFLASSVVIGVILPISNIKRIITIIGNYYLGVTMYTLITILTVDILRRIIRSVRKKEITIYSGLVCLIIVIFITLIGVVNARIIRVTNYDVKIDKESSINNLKVVMVADLHLGYNIGTVHMRQMVNKINKQNPDLVLMVGDIFENDYNTLDNPEELIEIFKGIKSKYGVYAVYGNHDIVSKNLAGFSFDIFKTSEKVSDIRMDELLEKSNIKLLKDEYVLIENSIYLYGRPDYQRPNRGIVERDTPEEIISKLDKNKPIIVMDHEPLQLEELSLTNVDLVLGGHTHGGQTFPGNILINLFWDNAYGYKKINNMHSIVTSGVGLFGPNVRLGTKSEIVVINITMK